MGFQSMSRADLCVKQKVYRKYERIVWEVWDECVQIDILS